MIHTSETVYDLTWHFRRVCRATTLLNPLLKGREATAQILEGFGYAPRSSPKYLSDAKVPQVAAFIIFGPEHMYDLGVSQPSSSTRRVLYCDRGPGTSKGQTLPL